MEGICGRMCDACTWKEQLDCPGCQDGPEAEVPLMMDQLRYSLSDIF